MAMDREEDGVVADPRDAAIEAGLTYVDADRPGSRAAGAEPGSPIAMPRASPSATRRS